MQPGGIDLTFLIMFCELQPEELGSDDWLSEEDDEDSELLELRASFILVYFIFLKTLPSDSESDSDSELEEEGVFTILRSAKSYFYFSFVSLLLDTVVPLIFSCVVFNCICQTCSC